MEQLKLGPVHMMMIQLDSEELRGEIADEIFVASEKEIIRVLDLLAIRREPDGTFTTIAMTDLSKKQHKELGAVIGGLLGLGAQGELGAVEGATMGAKRYAEQVFGLSKSDVRAIAEQIPSGKTLLMILFEHRWALGLKEAAAKANGVVLAEGIVRPEALVLAGATLAKS